MYVFVCVFCWTVCVWFGFFHCGPVVWSKMNWLLWLEMQLWRPYSRNTQQLLPSALRRCQTPLLVSWICSCLLQFKDLTVSASCPRGKAVGFNFTWLLKNKPPSLNRPQNATICMWGALNEAVKWKWIISVHSDLWAQIRAHQQPPARQAVCF